jgi:hypothetical protein
MAWYEGPVMSGEIMVKNQTLDLYRLRSREGLINTLTTSYSVLIS